MPDMAQAVPSVVYETTVTKIPGSDIIAAGRVERVALA